MKNNQDPKVDIRFSTEEYQALWNRSKKFNVPLSSYCRLILLEDGRLDPDLADVFKKLYDKRIIKMKLDLAHEESYLLFTTKYMIKRVFQSAYFSHKVSGDINMDEVNYFLEVYNEIIDLFPKKIKDLKKQEIKYLRNLADPHFLHQQLKTTTFNIGVAHNKYIKNVEEQIASLQGRRVKGQNMKGDT